MPRNTTTMLFAVLALALVTGAALMAGCGSTSTTTAEDTTTTGGAAPAGPGGSVAVESTNGGYPTSSIPDWGKIAAVRLN